MPLIEWTEELVVGVPVIDEAHHEFVNLLNALSEASDADFSILFARLVTHSQEHFAEEEDLMEQSSFPVIAVHKTEHKRVLAELEKVRQRLEEGDVAAARAYITDQLPTWFLLHRNTMDYVTAAHIQRVLD